MKMRIITTALAAAMAMSTSAALATNFTDTAGLNETQLSVLNDFVNRGIITGYEDGTVRPYGTLTRAEFAAMVARYMGYDTSGTANFTDTIGHWATGYIQACVNAGAINGMGDGTFAPESPVTFNQATKIVSVVSGMTNGQDIDAMGGYPLAYLTIGQNNGLFNNLTTGMTGTDYNFNRVDTIIMISNAGGGNSTSVTGNKTLDQMTQEEKNEFARLLYENTKDMQTEDPMVQAHGENLAGYFGSVNVDKDRYDKAVEGLANGVNLYLKEATVEFGDQIYILAGYDSSKTIDQMTQDEKNEFALALYNNTKDMQTKDPMVQAHGENLAGYFGSVNVDKDRYDKAVEGLANGVNLYLKEAAVEFGDDIYELAGY